MPNFSQLPLENTRQARRNICVRIAQGTLSGLLALVQSLRPASAPPRTVYPPVFVPGEDWEKVFIKHFEEALIEYAKADQLRKEYNQQRTRRLKQDYLRQEYQVLQKIFQGKEIFWPMIMGLVLVGPKRLAEPEWKNLFRQCAEERQEDFKDFCQTLLYSKNQYWGEWLLRLLSDIDYDLSFINLRQVDNSYIMSLLNIYKGARKKYSHVNEIDAAGDTILHQAIKNDDPGLAISLLLGIHNKKENIHHWGADGLTPLHLAAQRNSVPIVRALFDSIRFANQTLSPQKEPGAPTPYILAVQARHFEVVDLFLQNPDFQENPNPIVSIAGKTLIQSLVHDHNLFMTKKIAPHIVLKLLRNAEKEKEKGYNEQLLSDMFLILIFLREIPKLFTIIKDIAARQPDNPLQMEIAIKHAKFFKNKPLMRDLKNFLAKHTAFPPAKAQAMQLELETALDKNRIDNFIKTTTADYQHLFQEEWPSQALAGNETLLISLQHHHQAIQAKIKTSLLALKAFTQENPFACNSELSHQSNLFKHELTQLLEQYASHKKVFLSEEYKKFEDVVLSFEQRLEEINTFPIAQARIIVESNQGTETQRNLLLAQVENLEKVIEKCKAGIEDARNNKILPPTSFLDLARQCSRELTGSLVTFPVEAQRAKVYERKQRQVAQHEETQHNIAQLLEIFEGQQSKVDAFLIHFPEDISEEHHAAFASRLLMLREAYVRRSATVADASKNDTAENLLIILHNITDERVTGELMQRLQDERMAMQQAQAARQQVCMNEEASQIITGLQKHLQPIIQHAFFAKLSQKNEVFKSFCSVCQSTMIHLDRLSAVALGDEQREEIYRIQVWWQNNKEQIFHLGEALDNLVVQELNAMTFTPLHSARALAAVAAEPEIPYKAYFSRKKRLNHCLVNETSAQARNHLKKILTHLRDSPAEISPATKQSALLVSIAIVLDQFTSLDNNILLSQQVREIRAAIFHCLVTESEDESLYIKLYTFADSFFQTKEDLFNRFFEILPKCPPDYKRFLFVIENHIQVLQHYNMSVKQNQGNIDNPLFQAELAFRISQTDALFDDLNKVCENGDEISIELKRQYHLIAIQLGLSRRQLSDSAKAVRHQGPDAILGAVDAFCLALTKSLSREATVESHVAKVTQLNFR